MPTFIVTGPDGKKYRVTGPDGATPEQALAQVQSGAVPAVEPASPNLRALARAPGLAARYAIEGAGDIPAMITQPFATLGDMALDKLGVPKQYRFGDQRQVFSRIADTAGLPSPENAGERVVGDASRTFVSAMIGGGGANALAKGATGATQAALSRFGANLPQQASSAVGAGIAGGATREGGGGPIEQFAAAVLGGVGGGLGYSAAAGLANKVGNAYRQITSPRDISGVIEFELKRAGVDWDALSTQAKTQLVKDANDAVASGQPLSQDALRRLADYRNIGATPTTGELTMDPRLVTTQRNLAKVQASMPKIGDAIDLATIQNNNAKKVLATLGGIESSPADAFQTGQMTQAAIQAKDATARAAENALYSQARDTAGRAIPLDRRAFVDAAINNLVRGNKTAFLPGEIRSLLNQISTGKSSINGQSFDVPFDVNTIDSLKTTLASASRSTQDGNVKAAIKAVRDALENVQPRPAAQFGGQQVVTEGGAAALRAASDLPAESLAAFDKARSAARGLREWRDSAPFIGDALEGMDPQTFVKRHITGAGFEDLKSLKREVGGNPELLGAVRKQLVDYILQRGGADKDVTRFSSAGMKKALEALGPKLGVFFSPAEQAQIRSAVNVATYMQAQPIGSAVNNSNSGIFVVARMLGDLIRKAPVIGPLAGEPVANYITGVRANLQAREAANVTNALMLPAATQPRVPLAALLASIAATANGSQNDRRNEIAK